MAALNKRIDIDMTSLAIATAELSTLEVGREWIALMRGHPSAFQHCVMRERVYASKRLPAPNWGSTRQRIFERDGYACTYCGAIEYLECDHIVPVAKGGGHEDANLTTACRSCNRAKRDLMPEEWMA